MSRQARIRIPDGVYHVTTHGNGDMMIFEGPSEKWRLVDLVADTAKEFDWAMYAWCVMGNHYHFLLKTPEENLSEGMHHINMSYGEWYNKSRGRHGHVFQDRFFSILITEDSHLLEASRYVVLNPLRVGLVTTPQEWRWSSCGTAVLAAANAIVSAEMVLAGVDSVIPADEVIGAMDEVGRLMPISLKDTLGAGMSNTPTARRFQSKINENGNALTTTATL
jgi:REP element-mobilizing transposase RayT